MSRKIWAVIGVIAVIIISVVSGLYSINQEPSNQIKKIATDTSLSTADKNQKISDIIEARKTDCEDVKKQIIDALSSLYNENSQILSDKLSKDKVLKSFEEYYNSSMEKIDGKNDFGEYMYSVKYAGGSYASVKMAQAEYSGFDSFYFELTAMLDELKK